jgi:hypothetical protein
MIKHLMALTRHKSSHAGICRVGGVSAAVLVLVLAPGAGAAAAPAGVDITTVEGQAFSGTVVDGLPCPLDSATISWGDGTTSAGTSGQTPAIEGTHTYAEEGSYNGSVSYTVQPTQRLCPPGTQTTSFQATVQDAPLTATGSDSSGGAQQSLSAVVGHIVDANPGGSANDFTAQINWGDGSTTAGTVSAAAGGGFDISGSHTYASAGSYTLTTSIADLGGATTTATSTAQIAVGATPPPPPPPFQPQSASFSTVPSPPCGDNQVAFDPSASSGGNDSINRFVWTLDQSLPPYPPNHHELTTGPSDPVLTWIFRSYVSLGAYRGQRYHTPSKDDLLLPAGSSTGPVLYNVYDYTVVNPPVTVRLTVRDAHFQEVSTTQTVAFANPVVHQQVGYVAGDSWAIPGFAGPSWLVSGQRAEACPLTHSNFFGYQTNDTALVSLTGSPVRIVGHERIELKVRCPNPLGSCLGLLTVLPANTPYRARRHVAGAVIRRALAGALGSTTFVAPAGGTTSVSLRLNSRGRTLLRAHRLHRVMLVLGSLGTGGSVVLSTRSVRLRGVR